MFSDSTVPENHEGPLSPIFPQQSLPGFGPVAEDGLHPSALQGRLKRLIRRLNQCIHVKHKHNLIAIMEKHMDTTVLSGFIGVEGLRFRADAR